MPDPKARDLFQQKNFVELFRYLNPMWLKVCLETLDDLNKLSPFFFSCNPNQYQTELRAAGIFVERMEVAMSAVLHKNAHVMPYEQFRTVYADKLGKIPYEQQAQIKDFWFAGPTPGVSSGPTAPPVIGAQGDWYVTNLSGNTVSVVVAVGFTALAGTLELTNVNGDVLTLPLGLYGPSIGISYTPNLGKIVSKLPGVTKLMGRFPMLTRIVSSDEDKFAERVLLYLWAQSPKMRALITAFPAVKTLLDTLLKNRNAASGGAESWWSTAAGMVMGHGSTPLTKADFSGQCVCYAITGAAGPGNFGTYVLFFGIDRNWSPLWDAGTMIDLMKLDAKSKGVAVIASASLAVGFPSLGAGATIFWGEIV